MIGRPLLHLLALLAALSAGSGTCAQIAPDHHWIGFADKEGCGVDLGDPNAGLQLLSQRALGRQQGEKVKQRTSYHGQGFNLRWIAAARGSSVRCG